jgi:hypothetical protein
MKSWLSTNLDNLNLTNMDTDHEWDALISVWCFLQWRLKNWTINLHKNEESESENLIKPVGETIFCWPD